MQDSCKKYQFLARILKEISGLMKFLQYRSGSRNTSALSHIENSDTFLNVVFSATNMLHLCNSQIRTRLLGSVQKMTVMTYSKG